MGFNDTCNTGLVLGLGFSSTTLDSPSTVAVSAAEKPHPTAAAIEPSLTLALSSVPRKIASNNKNNNSDSSGHKAAGCDQEASGEHFFGRQQASPHHSAVSSFSSGRVKRERDLSSEETEVDDKVNSSRGSDEDDDAVNTRKKLRLTKDQSALLEESFKQQSTLNPKQKQALARQLNLRPRQVEVWFQNRRARTKLKQTEVDCEFLKKYCETLTDENRRLQKELQELKALKVAQPFYMHMPAARLTMCPSCERIGAATASASDGGGSKSQFSMAPKPHHNFFSPFTNPSAAC